MTRYETWLLEEKYGGDASAAGFVSDTLRLAGGEPLAYIIGVQPFLGLRISLGSRPLIPRVETEWWTHELLSSLRTGAGIPASLHARMERGDSVRFLDVCSGSGAIGCAALSHLERAQVFFGEVDPAHESTIRQNIASNGLDAARADIRIGDLFEPFAGQQFEVIATNPPYVPTGRALPASVSAYEPARALYAGEDGLALIRRIAADLPNHLAPDGIAWVECDSAHAPLACELFGAAGLSAQVHADQYGAPRVIRVVWR